MPFVLILGYDAFNMGDKIREDGFRRETWLRDKVGLGAAYDTIGLSVKLKWQLTAEEY